MVRCIVECFSFIAARYRFLGALVVKNLVSSRLRGENGHAQLAQTRKMCIRASPFRFRNPPPPHGVETTTQRIFLAIDPARKLG